MAETKPTEYLRDEMDFDDSSSAPPSEDARTLQGPVARIRRDAASASSRRDSGGPPPLKQIGRAHV
jgi:hypothetical protein